MLRWIGWAAALVVPGAAQWRQGRRRTALVWLALGSGVVLWTWWLNRTYLSLYWSFRSLLLPPGFCRWFYETVKLGAFRTNLALYGLIVLLSVIEAVLWSRFGGSRDVRRME